MSEPTKLCKSCDTEKPHSEFYFQRGKPSHPCKECKCTKKRDNYDPEKGREQWLRSKYGITTETFDLMFAEQNGTCAICSSVILPTGKNNLAVDHDHETGKVRGILCNNCNLGLGHFKDNMASLEAAIRYLHDHNNSDNSTERMV